MPFWPIIPVVVVVMLMLEGCTNKNGKDKDKSEDNTEEDTEKYTEVECTDAVKETETLEDTECTCKACVKCINATENSQPVHVKKDGVVIHISDIGRLNRKDVELDGHFLGCMVADKCCVDKNSIEGGMWMDYDDGNDEGEYKETLNRDTSYMVCTKYEDLGIIYFYDDGQEILNNLDEILLKYRTTFDQDLYDNNKFYKKTSDYISEIEGTDEEFEDLLKEIRETYNSQKTRYEQISKENGYIPPELIAAIHYRENASDYLAGSFGIYLHNGDPLGTASQKVPKPKLFNSDQFNAAAVDALIGEDDYYIIRAQQLKLTPDSKDLTAMVAFSVLYNGWSNDGKSSYAYSGTNLISTGLYISDGDYDPNASDENLGTYLVLKSLLNQ